jgi:hypothetical protein
VTYRTLGTLAADLRRRLGFAAGGAQAGVNDSHMKNLLFSAQTALYWDFDWPRLHKRVDKTLGLDAYLLNYPDELHPDRIDDPIYVQYSGTWQKVEQGIDPLKYTTQSNKSFPTRYEKREQLEFFPIANAAYTLRIFGTIPLRRFTEDNDLPTLDDEVLFLYALSTAKAHYRHPDATLIGNQWTRVENALKGKAWGQRVFHKPESGRVSDDEPPWPKPVTVP